MSALKLTRSFNHQESSVNPKLIQSRCNNCGNVIATSPTLPVLQIAESLHSCPAYIYYSR
jgi:hypothetical protein